MFHDVHLSNDRNVSNDLLSPPDVEGTLSRFSRLCEMEWVQCKADGASSSLRTLKSDNQEYGADLDGQYLLRSGGHYWFSVLQTPLAGVTLSGPPQVTQDGSPAPESIFNFTAPVSSINVGKWEKIRAQGAAPCPRRHHSMSPLPPITVPRRLLSADDIDNDSVISIRRILFFGGQSEGIPFEAFNDLHVLLVESFQKQASSEKPKARWIQPNAVGQAPLPRCGHCATLLSDHTLLVSGGSNGTSPLPTFEVFILHIVPDGGFGQFRWSTPSTTSVPRGRAMHSVFRDTNDAVLVFEGRQISHSNGLLDVHQLKLRRAQPGDEWHADWSEPPIRGCVPSPRRGHSTVAIGNRLLLIGGQNECSRDLSCDVRILDIPSLHWYQPTFSTDARPCPHRGFKSQYFGTSLTVSSGFVVNEKTGKCDLQLPDSDIHILTFE